MTRLRDNLRQWRDSAQIDWFSQFIKAWIPFNAWMTDTYGDLTDKELLDQVKGTGNVVRHRIVPMFTWRPGAVRGATGGWQDGSPEAQAFRLEIERLHRLLQSCVIEGRRGRISFETVDIGHNPKKGDSLVKWSRTFLVRRDHPTASEVTLEMSQPRAAANAFTLTLPRHERRLVEDDPSFQSLKVEQRSTFLALHAAVAPRRILSVLATHDATESLKIGETSFVSDPEKIFSAVVDICYSLRNALFHGSITPNEQHNAIYEPAYHIVMRFVRCTI